MDDGLKQRIVGAIVLVAIAMIFLPMLFDDNASNNGADQTQIPSPPQINETASADPEKFVESIPDVETAEQEQQKAWKEQDSATPDAFDEEAAPIEPVSEATVTQAPSPEVVKIADSGLAKAWTLQVGTFTDKAKASALNEKLIKKGFQSYMREIKDEKGSSFKVFVGPDTQRAHIDETKKKLLAIQKELQISGVLLKAYQP